MKDINVKECWITKSTDGNPHKRDFYFRDENDKIYHFTNCFPIDFTSKDLQVIQDQDEHKITIDYNKFEEHSNIDEIVGKTTTEMLQKWEELVKEGKD